MTFIYPAVFTPHKEDSGYHVYFPDLECCEADGPALDDAAEHARDAAYNWLWVEIEEGTYEFPEVSHDDEIPLDEGSFIRQIMWKFKLMPDND